MQCIIDRSLNERTNEWVLRLVRARKINWKICVLKNNSPTKVCNYNRRLLVFLLFTLDTHTDGLRRYVNELIQMLAISGSIDSKKKTFIDFILKWSIITSYYKINYLHEIKLIKHQFLAVASCAMSRKVFGCEPCWTLSLSDWCCCCHRRHLIRRFYFAIN